MFARKIVRTDGHFHLDGLDRRPWATLPFQGFDQLGLGMTDFSVAPPFFCHVTTSRKSCRFNSL